MTLMPFRESKIRLWHQRIRPDVKTLLRIMINGFPRRK